MIITSVDGRVTSSVYFLIIKVDARSVAGLTVSVAGDEQPSTRATITLSPWPTSHRLMKSRRRRTSVDGRITFRGYRDGCLESRRLDVEDKWMDQKMPIGCGLRRYMPDQGVFSY